MKAYSFFSLIFLFFLSCASVEHTLVWDGNYAHSFREGSGTIDDPYLISSCQELAYLITFSEEENTNDVFFCLTSDLDMNGHDPKCAWKPIGSQYTFNGRFDGNHKTISNLMIKKDELKKAGGLFAQIGKQGVVGDLNMKNTRMDYVAQFISGAITGINNGVIVLCRSTTVDRMYAGIAGRNNELIRQCNSGGEMNNVHGGICGENYGTIEYCYSTGNLSCGVMDFYVGGICAQNFAIIHSCAFNGSAQGDKFIGGIAGRSPQGEIYNCHNMGYIKGMGIVGYGNKARIENCYNAGETRGAPIADQISQQYNRSYFDYNIYTKGKSNSFTSYGRMSTSQMKAASFVKLLNDNYGTNVWEKDVSGINKGYPILKKVIYY